MPAPLDQVGHAKYQLWNLCNYVCSLYTVQAKDDAMFLVKHGRMEKIKVDVQEHCCQNQMIKFYRVWCSHGVFEDVSKM